MFKPVVCSFWSKSVDDMVKICCRFYSVQFFFFFFFCSAQKKSEQTKCIIKTQYHYLSKSDLDSFSGLILATLGCGYLLKYAERYGSQVRGETVCDHTEMTPCKGCHCSCFGLHRVKLLCSAICESDSPAVKNTCLTTPL